MNKKIFLGLFLIVFTCCIFCGCSLLKPHYTEEDVANMSEQQIDDARRNAAIEKKKLLESMPVSEDQALEICAKDLGVDVNSIKVLANQFLNKDDGCQYYIAFTYNKDSYSYVVDANSGEIKERNRNSSPF